ncbi:hypothetical protein [Vibrio cidicii]|jgi:hypothetical protein|uniref:hypothetical protein n=2 Tax=Vibrio cidicii TaxID=1763883 RepID=UPI00370427C1
MNFVKKYIIWVMDITLLIYIMVMSAFSKEDIAMSYNYTLTNLKDNYKAENSVQIILSKNKFQIFTIVEEGKKSTYEMKLTGDLIKINNDLYFLSHDDMMMRILNKSSPSIDSPVVKEIYSSKRALKEHNWIEVVERKDEYNILITSLYGGQVIGLNKY